MDNADSSVFSSIGVGEQAIHQVEENSEPDDMLLDDNHDTNPFQHFKATYRQQTHHSKKVSESLYSLQRVIFHYCCKFFPESYYIFPFCRP